MADSLQTLAPGVDGNKIAATNRPGNALTGPKLKGETARVDGSQIAGGRFVVMSPLYVANQGKLMNPMAVCYPFDETLLYVDRAKTETFADAGLTIDETMIYGVTESTMDCEDARCYFGDGYPFTYSDDNNYYNRYQHCGHCAVFREADIEVYLCEDVTDLNDPVTVYNVAGVDDTSTIAPGGAGPAGALALPNSRWLTTGKAGQTAFCRVVL